METDKPLSQLAYEAYAASAGWQNFKGEPMPVWAALPPHIQAHWTAAAIAVKDRSQRVLLFELAKAADGLE